MLKVSRLRNVKGFAKLCIPNAIKVSLVNCHWLLGTHHLHISHNTPCLPPKILYILCFQFLLGITVVPGEIWDSAYATFWGENNSGRCANGELHIWAYRTHFKDLLEWPPNNTFPMCNFPMPKATFIESCLFCGSFYITTNLKTKENKISTKNNIEPQDIYQRRTCLR